MIPLDESARRFKRSVLERHYEDAVATCGAEVDALPGLFPAAARRFPDDIANCAMEVADDLCVIDVVDHQRLIAACVCSPSYWRPQDKIGLPLWDVHGPVDGMNAKIGGRIASFIERSQPLRPFERRNWFLHGDAEQFHLAPEGEIKGPVEDWVVRSERQTLCRISAQHLLFTIHVRCLPLCDIRQSRNALEGLIGSLDAMDASEMAHFGGARKHERLVEQLLLWR